MTDTTHLEQLAAVLARTAQDRKATTERHARLWRMTPDERIAAMWRGDLSFLECQAWSRKRPQEVPLIGNEFAYIVMQTPEWLGE